MMDFNFEMRFFISMMGYVDVFLLRPVDFLEVDVSHPPTCTLMRFNYVKTNLEEFLNKWGRALHGSSFVSGTRLVFRGG